MAFQRAGVTPYRGGSLLSRFHEGWLGDPGT